MPRLLASPIARRRVAFYAFQVLLLGLVVAAVASHITTAGSDWRRFDRQTFTVSRTLDGDSLVISSPTGDTTVALLGVNAPDSPAPFAPRSAAYLRARAEGKRVTLRLEPAQTRDPAGRLLAYVYLSDSDCLNLDLIHDGQAFADRRQKHTLRAQFESAEAEPRKKQRGLWKDLHFSDMPTWRQQWLREQSRK